MPADAGLVRGRLVGDAAMLTTKSVRTDAVCAERAP